MVGILTMLSLVCLAMVFMLQSADDSDASLIGGSEGSCGDDAYWDYEKGTLRIYGEGDVNDYPADKEPWHKHTKSVKILRIEDGITSFNVSNPSRYANLTKISLGDSIRDFTFMENNSLGRIILEHGTGSLQHLKVFFKDNYVEMDSEALGMFSDNRSEISLKRVSPKELSLEDRDIAGYDPVYLFKAGSLGTIHGSVILGINQHGSEYMTVKHISPLYKVPSEDGKHLTVECHETGFYVLETNKRAIIPYSGEISIGLAVLFTALAIIYCVFVIRRQAP